MGSPLRHHDRLDQLIADIRRYEAEAREATRESCDAMSDLAIERAELVKGQLETARRQYIEESERQRVKKCPIHGDSIIAACPDCVRLHLQRPLRVA